MPTIYIDADACPVKQETYRVAKRYGLPVRVVANQWMAMPDDPSIRLEVVDDGFDAADDWIVDHAVRGDIVVSDDTPLAARCLDRGARVITCRGHVRNTATIGDALGSRQLMGYLRGAGEVGGGAKPLQKRDRSRFLQEMDRLVHAVRKSG